MHFDEFLDSFLLLFFPSILYILFEIVLNINAKKTINEELKENLLTLESNQNSLSYAIKVKTVLMMIFISSIEMIFSFFTRNDDWWLFDNKYFSFVYFVNLYAWHRSGKAIDLDYNEKKKNLYGMRIFWGLSFLQNLYLLMDYEEERCFVIVLLLKIICTFLLSIYALMKPYEKNYHLRYTPNFILFKVLNSWMETFESNFYVRVLFLGKDYDNFLKNEIEMIENEGQSFSDIIKKEEKLMKRLNNKHHYQLSIDEIEEDELLNCLPSVKVLIIKEPQESLPKSLKYHDPKAFFLVHTYLAWDTKLRLEYLTLKQYENFFDLEKSLNKFFSEQSFFQRPQYEFEKVGLSNCEDNESLLYKRRATILENFFNFYLLKNKHFIHPEILVFLNIEEQKKRPFLSYHDYLMKTKKIKNRRISHVRSRGTLQSINNPDYLGTENSDDMEIKSQNSIDLIGLKNFTCIFDIEFTELKKIPNKPLESLIVIHVIEQNIGFDWNVNHRLEDFIELNNSMERLFSAEEEFLTMKKKIDILYQVKENNFNYFFNFELVKKDVFEYLNYLASTSKFHCLTLFNFLEFDPTSMKRFNLIKSFNRLMIPTIRSNTNDSVLGNMRQQVSIMNLTENGSALAPKHHGSILSILEGNKMDPDERNKNVALFLRSVTERRHNSYKYEKIRDFFDLEKCKIEVPEYVIKGKNNEIIVHFIIFVNEYFEKDIWKIKRRVIIKKSFTEIDELHEVVYNFCEDRGYHIDENLGLKIEEKPLNIDNYVEKKKYIDHYLNKIIKIPDIGMNREVILFFELDKLVKAMEKEENLKFLYDFTNES